MSNVSLLAKLGATKAKAKDCLSLCTPDAVQAAQAWLQAKAAAKAGEAALEVTTAQLAPMLRASWFQQNSGRPRPTNSIEVATPSGVILGSFASVWTAAGGMDRIPADLQDPKWSLRIKSDAIPSAVAEPLVDELLALFTRYNLRDAIEAKGGPAPVAQFNELRHVRFSPAENEALEAAGLGTRLTLRVR